MVALLFMDAIYFRLWLLMLRGGDVALADFGETIIDLVQLPIPSLSITDKMIKGEVTHIDHFGNIITNIGTLSLAG